MKIGISRRSKCVRRTIYSSKLKEIFMRHLLSCLYRIQYKHESKTGGDIMNFRNRLNKLIDMKNGLILTKGCGRSRKFQNNFYRIL